MRELKTASGKAVHPIGIGTWGIGGKMAPSYEHDDEEVEAIKYSLSRGQNHIDGAEMYGDGHTDELIGRAIQGARRADLYLADKVTRRSVGAGKVRPAVERMLKSLDTDYLDLLYIHAPWADVPWMEAVPQINDLIDEGIVRQFGVSNFDVPDMKQTAAASRHPIAANQLLYNVLDTAAVPDALRKYCDEQEIVIVAYRPVERQAALHDEAVQAVARAHNATPAQVALAWLLEKGAVPIPKAVTMSHIDENLGALDVKLTAEDLRMLAR